MAQRCAMLPGMVETRTLEAAAAVQREIDDLFALGGKVAAVAGAGYEERDGQIDMAKAVESCFADNNVLLVEAPTGTGKSVAYLVPAILHAVRHKRRTCVVTANIALQEQLCVGPSDRILTADLRHVPAGEIQVGMRVLGFDEDRDGTRRRFHAADVVRVLRITRPSYRLTFDDGTTVVASEDHKWLCSRSATVQWLETKRLAPAVGKRLGSGVIRVVDEWAPKQDYIAGYLAAAVDGEGWLSQQRSNQYQGVTTKLGFSQNKNSMLEAVKEYLQVEGFHAVEKRHGRDWCSRLEIYDRKEILRFLGTYRPHRLLKAFDPELLGTLPTNKRVRLVAKEFLGDTEVIAISTTTRTMVVNGLASHNCNKDLPFLQRVFADTPFKFALAKGLNNYLCLDRWDDAYALSLVRPKYTVENEGQIWDQLDRWVHATTTGDLSELPFEVPGKVRGEVTTASDDCIGRTCKHYDGCFGMKARKRVQEAEIVVTNYHLFFADLVIKQMTDYNGGVLPEYDYVVMDEAHQAPDIARDFFGWRASMGAVKWAVRQLPHDVRDNVTDAAEVFFTSLGAGPGPKGERLRPRIKAAGEVDGARLAELLLDAATKLGQKASLELVPEAKAKLQKAEGRSRDIAANLVLVTDLTQPPGTRLVYFAEPPTNPRGYWAVGMKPLDVAPILEKALFETGGKIKAVVGTSATLTTAGSFDFIIGQLGCYDTNELQVPSPFDHTGAAVLVVPQDLPDPKGALFAERVGEVLVEAVRAAQGRTLGLFTSYKVLNEAHRALVAARLPYKVFKQGDKPRTQLIADFRQDIHSVLLGTDSFWEGIDVQGEALSCVVIDRLPFEHPDDPVFESICERSPKTWFMEYALPKSIIAMRQGFGRLIRSRTDRGAIVVCDRRIIDKPYGRRYIRSFPDGVALVRNMQAIVEVLEAK